MKMTTVSLSLLRPLAAAAVAFGVAVAIQHVTKLGDSLPGTAILGSILIATYVFLLMRVGGISKADRRTLMIAIRPSAVTPASEPSTGSYG
jgi:hypothetical protein